jgi:Uma2 family endonuclease
MATTRDIQTTPAPRRPRADPNAPFRYGWRRVKRFNQHGRVVWRREPLTLEDVLHPRPGDHVVHNEPHERWCIYLYNVLAAQVAHDPAAVVLHDVLIEWDIPRLRGHGPDLAVIQGVRERRGWSVFDVTMEGVRPSLLIEVTSPSTAKIDRLIKPRHYARARVPLYIIVDLVPTRHHPTPSLIGYTLTPGGYRRLAPDARGRLWLEPVRLWLGIAGEEVICHDEHDRRLTDYPALKTDLAAAEQRADEAEARVRALEAELRRLRGDTA